MRPEKLKNDFDDVIVAQQPVYETTLRYSESFTGVSLDDSGPVVTSARKNLATSATPSKSPAHKRNKFSLKKRNGLTLSTAAPAVEAFPPNDPFRFTGEGVEFKAKLIGIQEVPGPRGDIISQEAMQICKAAAKKSGQHKQRVLFNISLEGLKIKDTTSKNVLHSFPVSKVSFISRDVTDSRVFSFIHGVPENKHQLFAIKTEKSAEVAVLSIRDMFHIVYDMKKKQLEGAKQLETMKTPVNGTTKVDKTQPPEGVLVDLLDLETEVDSLQEKMKSMESAWNDVEKSWSNGGQLAPMDPSSNHAYYNSPSSPNFLETDDMHSDYSNLTSSSSSGPSSNNFHQNSTDPFNDPFFPELSYSNFANCNSFSGKTSCSEDSWNCSTKSRFSHDDFTSAAGVNPCDDPFDTSRVVSALKLQQPPTELPAATGTTTTSVAENTSDSPSHSQANGFSPPPASSTGCLPNGNSGISTSRATNSFCSVENGDNERFGESCLSSNCASEATTTTAAGSTECHEAQNFDPMSVESAATASQSTKKGQGVTNGIFDAAFSTLCNIDRLDTVGQATEKKDPFAHMRGPRKKSMNQLKFGDAADTLFDPGDIEGWQFSPNSSSSGSGPEASNGSVENDAAGMLHTHGSGSRTNRPTVRQPPPINLPASLPPPPVPPRSQSTLPVGSRVGGSPCDGHSPVTALHATTIHLCSPSSKAQQPELAKNLFAQNDPFQDEFFRS